LKNKNKNMKMHRIPDSIFGPQTYWPPKLARGTVDIGIHVSSSLIFLAIFRKEAEHFTQLFGKLIKFSVLQLKSLGKKSE